MPDDHFLSYIMCDIGKINSINIATDATKLIIPSVNPHSAFFDEPYYVKLIKLNIIALIGIIKYNPINVVEGIEIIPKV